MSATGPVELSTDCEACLLEGGVVEIYDPLVAACRFGLPASTRCKLCAVLHEGVFDGAPQRSLSETPANRCPACQAELGPEAVDSRRCGGCAASARLALRAPPRAFASLSELEAALDAWATHEGFGSRDALVAATFVEADLAKIFARIGARERLEIVADPFANMGMRATGGGAPAAAPEKPPAILLVPAAVAKDEDPPPRSAPPRALVYPLVSVIAADGEIHPEERALIDRFLKSEGLPPLAEEEFRVHAPAEVAHFVPASRREEVVKLMCESAACDGLPDESERRVIRAYASAWHIDDEKLELWMWAQEQVNTSLPRQLFLKLRRFVLSARWSDSEEG